MTYLEALAAVSDAHRPEIEKALEQAREALVAAQQSHEASRRQVVHLECLLAANSRATPTPHGLASDEGEPRSPMTLHAAMHRVLLDAPGRKLRASEIIAEIGRRGLYRMRDGRLPESQQIHARAGHYPNLFGKDGSSFYPK